MSLSEDIMEQLILDGCAEMAGIDLESGDMLYNFTPVLAEKHPELFAEIANFFQTQVMLLWEKGFISMDIMDDSPTVTLTDLAFDQEAVDTLSSDLKRTLESVMEEFSKDK
jgi:hypothetical protein